MAELKSTLSGTTLTLHATGRIDSANAPEIEEKIKQATATTFEDVILDLDGLEYLSSAGLRVILRLRKDAPTLKIINASSEVYDIFDMTGFTEMMTIEKAYRRISVEGCEVIGQGANGKVYRIDPDTIVKYYMNNDALPDIHRERELARKAFVLGIPTAIPYDVVKVGDGYGSVFELLNADSFAKLIIKHPENIDEYVAASVDILKKMHETDVNPDDMPHVKDEAMGWIRDLAPLLPEKTAAKVTALFEAVPDSNKMMHGDYHIKNIMMQNGEALLIDMDTLCHGNAIFELANTYKAYKGYIMSDPSNTQDFLGISAETGIYFWDKMLELYMGTTDKAVLEEVEKKACLICCVRLARKCSKSPDKKAGFEIYKAKVIELAEEVDSLAI